MRDLPVFLSVLFILCTIFTVIILWMSSNHSKKALLLSLSWLILQGVLSYSMFYEDTFSFPPRFVLLLLPAILFVVVLFFSKKGKRFIDSLDLKTLYLVHIVRIPVEIGLYSLATYQVIPFLMTFEGVNFDIFAGLSAPFIILGYFVKDWLSDSFVLIWNIMSLGLLEAIVVNAMLSVPSPLQTQALEQPNVAILYFPFSWLACFIVPIVFFAHLVAIKRAYSK